MPLDDDPLRAWILLTADLLAIGWLNRRPGSVASR